MTDSEDDQRQTIDETLLTKEGFSVSMPQNMPIGDSIIITTLNAITTQRNKNVAFDAQPKKDEECLSIRESEFCI